MFNRLKFILLIFLYLLVGQSALAAATVQPPEQSYDSVIAEAKKGVAETIEGRNFAPVRDLFPMVLEEKVPMFLCGACAKTYNISEDDLVEGVKIAHIPTIAAEMIDRETITF